MDPTRSPGAGIGDRAPFHRFLEAENRIDDLERPRFVDLQQARLPQARAEACSNPPRRCDSFERIPGADDLRPPLLPRLGEVLPVEPRPKENTPETIGCPQPIVTGRLLDVYL